MRSQEAQAVEGKLGGWRRKRNYYGSLALSRADRLELRRAGGVEGLADEIALLRAQLKRAVEASPRTVKARKDLKVVSEGVETLLRAVSSQYRLSPRASGDLADNIAAVLKGFGDQLVPADR
jgi:hypothetical protein